MRSRPSPKSLGYLVGVGEGCFSVITPFASTFSLLILVCMYVSLLGLIDCLLQVWISKGFVLLLEARLSKAKARREASSSMPTPEAMAGVTLVGDGESVLEEIHLQPEGGGGDAEIGGEAVGGMIPPLPQVGDPEMLPPAPLGDLDGVAETGVPGAKPLRRDTGKRPRVGEDSNAESDIEIESLYGRGQNRGTAHSFWDFNDPFLTTQRARLMASDYDLRRLDELGPRYAMREIMNSGCRVSFYA